MGSIFSGRKPAKLTKPFPEHFVSLDIRELDKCEGLEPGKAYNQNKFRQGKKDGAFSVIVYENYLKLSYRTCNHPESRFPSQIINLTQTPCNFGGYRPWFLCPGDQCGRRVAILYGPNLMQCRHCWGIAYQSQRENQIQRMSRKLRSIGASYTGRPNDSAPRDRTRPVGMHHRTFKLLQEKHQLLFTDIQFAQIEELRRLDEILDEWG